jgi:PII-like signaling protein
MQAFLDFLFFRGVAGATMLKGAAGFGAEHHIHSADSVEIMRYSRSPQKPSVS